MLITTKQQTEAGTLLKLRATRCVNLRGTKSVLNGIEFLVDSKRKQYSDSPATIDLRIEIKNTDKFLLRNIFRINNNFTLR